MTEYMKQYKVINGDNPFEGLDPERIKANREYLIQMKKALQSQKRKEIFNEIIFVLEKAEALAAS